MYLSIDYLDGANGLTRKKEEAPESIVGYTWKQKNHRLCDAGREP